MSDSSQLPPPDRPEEADADPVDADQADADQAASDRRTVIVGRTTPRSQELRVSADETVNPFPGPWKVKALVQDREADSLPKLQADPPELSVVQGEQAQAMTAEAPVADAPETEAPEAKSGVDHGADLGADHGADDGSHDGADNGDLGGDSPQLRLL